MALLACCVYPAVSFICQPLTDALQSFLQTAAQDLFSFLRGWGTGEINRRMLHRESAAVEVPVLAAFIVGADETLADIRKLLRDDSARVIGIWGMGGIGKTTLLQTINNDFLKPGTQGTFDLVIWVTVSREVNIPNIQKQIGSRLGLSFSKSDQSGDSSSQVEEQRQLLFKALSDPKKQFLLLLDDVWPELDLEKIGIPEPRSRKNCKIAFTTRSLQVCTDMGANEKIVEVKRLNETQSRVLFRSKLRRDVALITSIQDLVEQIVEKCGGLPLALITVGRAMANRNHPNEWKDAIKKLDDSAQELGDMKKVLSCLKLSYDYLENNKMRSGLIFCAMYPEDAEISRSELIEYWIGEGLTDGDDIDDARNSGHVLISKLSDACMLETGIVNAEQNVRVHDAVRDMALWLHKQESESAEVDGFLVLPGVNLTQRREHVKRIWMRNMVLKVSPSPIPNCPNTWTLLLNHTTLEPSALRGFFSSMRSLRVLDLSMSELEELPNEIGLVGELQYLNLSWTRIRSLPEELGQLTGLRQLELQWTYKLRWVPRKAIVGLSSLQVLNMWRSGYDWGTHGETTEGNQWRSSSSDDAGGGGGQQLELSDLEELDRLQELQIGLCSSRALERIPEPPSEGPCRCMKYLHLA